MYSLMPIHITIVKMITIGILRYFNKLPLHGVYSTHTTLRIPHISFTAPIDYMIPHHSAPLRTMIRTHLIVECTHFLKCTHSELFCISRTPYHIPITISHTAHHITHRTAHLTSRTAHSTAYNDI